MFYLKKKTKTITSKRTKDISNIRNIFEQIKGLEVQVKLERSVRGIFTKNQLIIANLN